MSFYFLLKVLIVTFYIIIIRATLPRFRIDTFQQTVWKTWIFILFIELLIIVMFNIMFFI